MKTYTCMGCRKKFPRREMHKALYCRKCLIEMKKMYKHSTIPTLDLDKLTKVYQKWKWYKTEVVAGWYYKIDKKEFGVYDSKRAAEASLLMRLKDYSWRE